MIKNTPTNHACYLGVKLHQLTHHSTILNLELHHKKYPTLSSQRTTPTLFHKSPHPQDSSNTPPPQIHPTHAHLKMSHRTLLNESFISSLLFSPMRSKKSKGSLTSRRMKEKRLRDWHKQASRPLVLLIF